MTISVNDGGVWKDALAYVNDGGTWKEAEVYVNDAGTWKQVGYIIDHTLSPTSKSAATTASAYVLPGAVTNPLTGGPVSSRTWGFYGQTNGTWSITSGQGTASVTIQCAATTQELTSTATLYCDAVVAGKTYRSIASCSYTWVDNS